MSHGGTAAFMASWPEFLRSQAQGILDFFTADLLDGAKIYVLAAIEHGTRRVRVLGATEHPVQAWIVQQARNLLMDLEDAGTRMKFVLHDRDASFTLAFDAVFRAAGMRVTRSAVQAPRMNSIMDRQLPAGAAGPHPDLEPAAPDDRAARVRGLLQHSPAPPNPKPGSAEDKSSADSRTNTRSPLDGPALLREGVECSRFFGHQIQAAN